MSLYDLKRIVKDINNISHKISLDKIKILEVCGTHTNAIAKFGIKNIIDKKINLISGPGCPVCVTYEGYIDAAVHLAREGIVVVTFGDLMRVNGKVANLLEEKAKGRDIRVIYSVYDVIKMAKENKSKEFVFLAIGFETTAPLIASLVNQVVNLKIKNLYFLFSLKVMPPILDKLLKFNEENIQGIICPGNVAVVSGAKNFKFIYDNYKLPAVISGFEERDIIASIHFLISSIENRTKGQEIEGFKNLYSRFVREEGNMKAKTLVEKYFSIHSSLWRGIGLVENSGLKLKKEYAYMDAEEKFNLESCLSKGDANYKKNSLCKCTEVLMAKVSPKECKLFGSLCTPRAPYGPCMVSTEGACSAYYKYG